MQFGNLSRRVITKFIKTRKHNSLTIRADIAIAEEVGDAIREAKDEKDFLERTLPDRLIAIMEKVEYVYFELTGRNL